MATIHNPTPFSLFCEPIRESIGAGGTVEVVESVAARVNPAVFIVVTDEGPEEVPEEKPKRATRTTAKRGGKQAEVSGPPAGETR